MEIQIFLLFIYWSSGAVLTFKVTGYAGSAVVIKCGYDKRYQQNKKYFCKSPNTLSCNDLIKTHRKDQWVNAGRFSLYDNTTGRFFMVIFRDLTLEDTGKYYCGVERKRFHDKYTNMDLTIRKDECCMKSLNISAYEGETVDVSCKFPLDHKKKPKYFRKEFWGSECKYSLSTQKNQWWVGNEKLSLHDNREGILTVSINSFSTSDAGSYWCGVDMGQYEAWITHVKITLNINKKDKSGGGVVIVITTIVIITISIIIVIIWRWRRNNTHRPDGTPNLILANVGPTAQAISIYTVHPVKDFNDTSYTNVHIPDAVFQQLNAETKQQGPVYQHLNPSTMQEESVYELLTTKAMLTHAE